MSLGVHKQHVSIFVGSTFEDLKGHRRSVRDALAQLEAIVHGMEYFGAKPGTPLDECLHAVRSSKLYIGVFGMRYGTTPDGCDKSMTHLEYEEAQRQNLPSLIYLIDEQNQPILPRFVETGAGAEKLMALKKVLRKRHVVSLFTTPEDLAGKILHDVPEALCRIGVAGDSDVDSSPTLLEKRQSSEIRRVELTLKIALRECDDQQQRLVVFALAGFLGVPPDSISIVSVKEGSVKITVELSSDLAYKLEEAWQRKDPEFSRRMKPFQLADLTSERGDEILTGLLLVESARPVGEGQPASACEVAGPQTLLERDKRTSSESLMRYLKEISRVPRVTPTEERELGRRIQNGDMPALRRLVEANLRFVVSYAKRYRGCGLSFLDLINEGNIGLIEAAKRFDSDKQVKFITYAVWWVRRAIIHALSDQSGAFRLPQKQANLLYRIGKAQSNLRSELQRAPTTEEIAQRMEVPVADVDNLLQVSDENISLSAVIDEEHDFHLADKLERETIPSADLVLLKESLKRLLRNALTELDAKEMEVVRLRFGLAGGDPKTLKEIGEMMNLSRERVRQLEAQAIAKMNRSPSIQQLRAYVS